MSLGCDRLRDEQQFCLPQKLSMKEPFFFFYSRAVHVLKLGSYRAAFYNVILEVSACHMEIGSNITCAFEVSISLFVSHNLKAPQYLKLSKMLKLEAKQLL